jgi:two-component system, OmpR family, response regulator
VGAPPADPPPILGPGPPHGPGSAPGAAVPALAVLLAEHEPEVAELARRYLTRAGAAVTITTGADETTAALIARTADVAVLDLTMPGLDARRLRRLIIDQQKPQQPQKTSPSRLPTLFLLSPSMRPRDLRIAAESCLYRPFSPRLLVSRVLAVAPHPAASHPAAAPGPPAPPTLTSTTTLTSTHIDTTSPTRIPVPTSPLTPAESALLSALADHPGHVLSRSRLQAIVGRSTPGHPASGRAIDVHVSSLRAKLPDPSLVRTVRGVGYILDEPSQPLDEPSQTLDEPSQPLDELSPTLDDPGQTGSDAPGGEGG